jgi:hypothetical protein
VVNRAGTFFRSLFSPALPASSKRGEKSDLASTPRVNGKGEIKRKNPDDFDPVTRILAL